MNESQKISRLGDIIYAFDKESIFSHLKLVGSSAFLFLIPGINYYKNELNFDLHTDQNIQGLNDLRKGIVDLLPKVLQTKNFSFDLKKSQMTLYHDKFIVKDNLSKENYIINIDYLNRAHILNPEYFARKDDVFTDLHINALSMLENYARYFIEVLYQNENTTILDEIINKQKIMPQQYPFIRKMICFYSTIDSDLKQIKVDQNYIELFSKLTDYTANELEFINKFNEGFYQPELLFGEILSKSIKRHPKALNSVKKKESK